MRRTQLIIAAALSAPLFVWGPATLAQSTDSFGGISGYDESLEAISPADGALTIGLAGQQPAHIARYLMARGAGSARLSPSGDHVAFSYDVTGENQLWIVSATGGSPRQLTFGNGISFFRWTPDGSSILYGADNDGNEREAYYLISADGLSEKEVLPATSNGFRSFGDFASGGTFFYASTERNGLDFDTWVSDLDGNARMVFEGSYAIRPQSVSPDGKHVIVTEAVGEDGDNVYLMDVASAELRPVSVPDPRANHGDAGFVWTQDSRAFYFATNREGEFTRVARYDVAAESMLLVDGASDPGHDVASVGLCHGDRILLWTENHDGFYQLKGMNLETGNAIETPDFGDGTLSFDCTPERQQLLVRVNSWQHPAELFTWDFSDAAPTRIFEANLAGIDPDTLVKPESIRMRARDGVELQGLLYLPKQPAPDGGFPILFDVHGGPTSQSVAGFEAVAQYHVQNGIAVFQPNVRGSTGFGRTYTQLDDRENRLDSIRDRWIDVYNPTSFFLKDLAWHFASIANRNAFGFDIDIVHEMQYTEYLSDNNGTYGWHHDVFWGSNRPYDRKLSVIFQLTDESDYQGGDFQIESQYEQPWANSVKKKGTVIVFPSFIPHQVTPVTSGLRRSLVTWIEGPKFK